MRMTDTVSPRRWWVNGSDVLVASVLDAYRTFGVAVWDHMEDRAAGEMGSVANDLPSLQIIRSPEIKHTDRDTPDWIPESGLEAVARAFAGAAWSTFTFSNSRVFRASAMETISAGLTPSAPTCTTGFRLCASLRRNARCFDVSSFINV